MQCVLLRRWHLQMDPPNHAQSGDRTALCLPALRAGVSAEIAYEVQKYAFDYLDAPVTRVNAADTSLPYAAAYVEAYLPNPAKIIKAVKEVMYVNQ